MILGDLSGLYFVKFVHVDVCLSFVVSGKYLLRQSATAPLGFVSPWGCCIHRLLAMALDCPLY